MINRLIRGHDLDRVYRAYAFDLRPVSDDRPFFFYQNRFRDAWRALTRWNFIFHGNGLTVLIKLLVISGFAVALFMGLPLLVFRRRGLGDLRSASLFGLYFLCLGIGFILLEIVLVQMFGYYLGNPLLGLGISLASLLISTGIGSGLGARWSDSKLMPRLRFVLMAIIALTCLYYRLLPPIIYSTTAHHVVVRCVIAVGLVAPLGLLLGLPFPTGLRLLGRRTSLVPWMWALNAGATVFGSTLATMMVIHVGFSATILIGLIPYAAALLWLRGIRLARSETA